MAKAVEKKTIPMDSARRFVGQRVTVAGCYAGDEYLYIGKFVGTTVFHDADDKPRYGIHLTGCAVENESGERSGVFVPLRGVEYIKGDREEVSVTD